MWKLDNQTPYAASQTWIRDADGAEVWIVAVKATYEFLPDGRLQLAAQQLPVHSGLVLDQDEKSPLFETDLGPPKNATDIWLSGHAHSQDGRAVTRLRVGFAVGPVVRQMDVVGERDARDAGAQPRPFVRMPLTWARAFGGGGPECASGNPVGCGLRAQADGSRPLPNLTDPAHPDSKLGYGFGPIPRHWPLRAQYSGTYDGHWQQTRAPLQALDLDPRHWQVAPPAQQVSGHLHGGEAIALHNLTPAGFAPSGIVRSTLPRITLGFQTRFTDGSRATSRSVIHNVILLPDGYAGSAPLVCVVHHMALPCHARVNLLDRTIITEKRRPLDHAAPPRGEVHQNSPAWELA